MKVLKGISAVLALIVIFVILAMIGVLGWILSSLIGFVITGICIIVFIAWAIKGEPIKQDKAP